MSRRLHTTEVQRLLANMERRLAELDDGGWVMLVDGKPLVVGSHSKDPDAAWGRARRGWAKGYKLHAIYDGGSIPVAWEIAPLNEAEPETAARLVLSIRGGGGYILGDKAYDSNPLHDAALAVGCQLVAERKRPKSGLGIAATARAIAFDRIAAKSSDNSCIAFATKSNATSAGSPTTPPASHPCPPGRRSHRVPPLRVQAELLAHAVYIQSHPSTPVAAA